MEFLTVLSQLGIPGWALVFCVLLIVLKYTGVLSALGDFFAKMGVAKQQNLSFLINNITDRLSDDVEKVSIVLERTIEKIEQNNNRLTSKLDENSNKLTSKLDANNKDSIENVEACNRILMDNIKELLAFNQDLNRTMINLGTKVQFVYYETVERPYEQREELLKVIMNLQARVEELEQQKL